MHVNLSVWTRLLPVWALVCLCVPLHSAPKIRSAPWQVIGPGGGGALFEPTISPQDPGRVLVACDMTGAYITADAGESWRMFNLRGTVRFFVFDPLYANVIYAQSIGLWRTTDAARSWRLVYPSPADVTGVEMTGDHAGETIVTANGPAASLSALAIDPADSRVLYAAFRQGASYNLRMSLDWGKTWKALTDLAAGAQKIYVDPHSPHDDRTIYVLASTYILVRDRGKWQRRELPHGVDSLLDVSASFPERGGAPVMYAATATGIFVSDDGGISWRPSQLPGSSARIRAIAASPNHADIAYVSYGNLRKGLLGFGTGFFGVARTSDRGASWELVREESDHPAANIHDAWITEFFGPGYGANPLSLGVAPTDPNVVYSGDYGRVLRTTDGGKNWQAVYSTRIPDSTFSGRGLEATGSFGVHFDPFDPKRIFISYIDIGLFRSENGGQSWTTSTIGVPGAWRNTTYWMVFDPEVRGRAWAVMSAVHDLPRPKMWRRKSPPTYEGGVCISEDGGRTWHKSSDGMTSTAATHILLDPRSPPNARVLYVAGFGRGVYKSSDGGKNWSLKNDGIPGVEPLAWRLSRDSAGTLYLVVARRSDDGGLGNDGDGALYRSTDGAEHWTRLKLPEDVNGPNGLAIDPRDPKHLYLAAWGRSVPHRAQGGGVYVSTDAGNTWRKAFAKDQHIYDVTVDPDNPRVIYAAGFESSAWHSTDAGRTWQRIAGFNFKWAHRVILDLVDRQKIYITTFGGGLWHGPANGDADTPNEIATPILEHGK